VTRRSLCLPCQHGSSSRCGSNSKPCCPNGRPTHPDHPLGCHKPRIGDRIVFDKLVGVLVFGCSYEKIVDATCLATAIRDRRDEWIRLGPVSRITLGPR
jgi:hypothetical protein